MNRLLLCVGDRPCTGGQVLPHQNTDFTIDGYQPALIGGRVLCTTCHTTGLLAKAGGPCRPSVDSQELGLEGDIVQCACSPYPVVRAHLQSKIQFDDWAEICIAPRPLREPVCGEFHLPLPNHTSRNTRCSA